MVNTGSADNERITGPNWSPGKNSHAPASEIHPMNERREQITSDKMINAQGSHAGHQTA